MGDQSSCFRLLKWKTGIEVLKNEITCIFEVLIRIHRLKSTYSKYWRYLRVTNRYMLNKHCFEWFKKKIWFVDIFILQILSVLILSILHALSPVFIHTHVILYNFLKIFFQYRPIALCGIVPRPSLGCFFMACWGYGRFMVKDHFTSCCRIVN